jgi:hypothetical protein
VSAAAARPSALARVLRVMGVVHGSLLVLGETLRSWGQGRPLAFVLDDFLIGGGVVVASLLFREDNLGRRAALAAAWGANAGMLYPSFFGKLLAGGNPQLQSNIPDGVLTALIGLAFGASLVWMVVTIALRPAGPA